MERQECKAKDEEKEKRELAKLEWKVKKQKHKAKDKAKEKKKSAWLEQNIERQEYKVKGKDAKDLSYQGTHLFFVSRFSLNFFCVLAATFYF